ncbi:MAG: MFS transporter [Methanoregulaceae archaeon]|nr:MFS transporter [Methanoregulaceae archaeon]
MNTRVLLCLGIFAVMALSNAIVPVLPAYGEGTIAQGALYSAYFLGAFLLVLPAGVLADRTGPLPLVKIGLALTLMSGLLLLTGSSVFIIVIYRFLEGIGAGLFVPSALSLINAEPDHETGSGYFMALLNIGLVAGLIGSGWLAEVTESPESGIFFFTILSLIPAAFSIFLRPGPIKEFPPESFREIGRRLVRVIRVYFWLWVSTIIILGITGALTVLYPEYSGLSPGILGLTIAAMSLSTAATVVLVSHAHLPPIPIIRVASLGMAAAVLCVILTPFSFIAVGAFAGVVMIGQLAFLAESEVHQGVVMGLFNTASYAGMTFLPFVAGFIAEISSFMIAFMVLALSGVLVAITIGQCDCRLSGVKVTLQERD